MTAEITNTKNLKLCGCGCGEFIPIISFGRKLGFKNGHNSHGSKIIEERSCYACGVGQSLKKVRGRSNVCWYHNLPIGFLCVRCNDSIIRNPKRQNRKNTMYQINQELEMRKCYTCGIINTNLQDSEYWVLNYDSVGNVLCSTCFYRYIYNPRRNVFSLNYKGRSIHFDKPVRKGICQLCGRSKLKGEIKRTHRHHYSTYIDNRPLDHTIEVCSSCHAYETWRLDQFSKKRKKVLS